MLDAYGLGRLAVGTFDEGARWIIGAGSDWRLGPLIGDLFADAVGAAFSAIMPTPLEVRG